MAPTPEEQALVDRFRRGEDSAFDGIVERYAGEVAALANRLLGWPGDAEDVVQEVFLAAFVARRRFRGDCRLRSWLFTIAINKCRSYRVQRKRRLRPAPVEAAALVGPSGCDRPVMDAETFASVRREVQALPPKYREVIVLRYLQDLETEEICELLGITPNSMQVRLNRARKCLQDRLGDLFEEKS